jgi:hypothetical protein
MSKSKPITRAKNVFAPVPEVAPISAYTITYGSPGVNIAGSVYVAKPKTGGDLVWSPDPTQELIFYFGHCIDTLESLIGSLHGVERARVEVLIGTYRNVIMLAQAGGQ